MTFKQLFAHFKFDFIDCVVIDCHECLKSKDFKVGKVLGFSQAKPSPTVPGLKLRNAEYQLQLGTHKLSVISCAAEMMLELTPLDYAAVFVCVFRLRLTA